MGMFASVVRFFVVFALFAGIVCGGAYAFLAVAVAPGMFGVRQVNFGPNQGFSEVGLPPGLYLKIPFYSEFYPVPQTAQRLSLRRGSGQTLEIQSADRATIDLDVTVVFRYLVARQSIGTAQSGGPRELFTGLGNLPSAWEIKVRRAVDDSMKRTLGQLSTNELYNPILREEKIREALDLINSGLPDEKLEGTLSKGIKVEALLLERYTFRDPRIENAIFQKNLQDQEAALNQAEARYAEALAHSAQEEARGEATNQNMLIEGDNKARVVRSEGDRYETEKKAQGDLAVNQARAEMDRLKSQLLASGAQNYIARELAPLVGTLKGGIVENPAGIDVAELAKHLGAQQGGVQ